ncbi:MAG: DUF3622 domain-containing protein [Gammaproteobacteria bacterium]|nr:DUF3622 domain-containing protein [Gammaproteobacteria bacterium]MCP5135720.1 DUF3622 domain-containing protein [Gammaproteobacteria bacterium]
MSSTPKFTIRIVPTDDTWRAEIVRRVTAKRHHVSKAQDNFRSEAEAQSWADAELKNFLANLAKRTQKDLTRRVEKAAKGGRG